MIIPNPMGEPFPFDERKVGELSDENLEAVVRDRKRMRHEARVQVQQEFTNFVHSSKDVQRFLRLVIAKHDRTTCSDDGIANVGRCQRCTLLHIIAGNDLDDGAEWHVSIRGGAHP